MAENNSIKKIVYYPGCTLHTWAKSLSDTFIESFKKLGINLHEMSDWSCCQAVFPLARDNIMGLVPAARILIQAREHGDFLTTLCSFCFNVLRRTNNVIQTDREIRAKLNAYLEEDYNGDVHVVHPLEILKVLLGFDKLKSKVTKPMRNIKIGPYYGCQLIRPPKEMKFDDPEDPKLLDMFLESIGCDVINYPFKVECCGSYQIIQGEDIVVERTYSILSNARKNGAEAIALSCPLCFYNLDTKQNLVSKKYPGFSPMPIFYFTELLAVALGIKEELCGFDKHTVDPSMLIESIQKSSDMQESVTVTKDQEQ